MEEGSWACAGNWNTVPVADPLGVEDVPLKPLRKPLPFDMPLDPLPRPLPSLPFPFPLEFGAAFAFAEGPDPCELVTA